MPPGFFELNFPVSGITLSPHSARVVQCEFGHDLAEMEIRRDALSSRRYRTGFPVRLIWGLYPSAINNLLGYIHHIEPIINSNSNTARNRVVIIGATFALKQERQRVWSAVYPEQIARQIARENGFAIRVDASRYPMDSLVQSNNSDWSFLSDLAKKVGFTFFAIGSELQFRDRTRVFSEERNRAVYFRRGQNVINFQPAYGEDNEDRPAVRQIHGITPTGEVFGARQTALIEGEPGLPAPLFSEQETVSVDSLARARDALRAAHARSALYYRAELEAPGNPRVRQGAVVVVEGYGARFDGFWYVTEVEHLLSRANYHMRVQLGRSKTQDVGGRPSRTTGRLTARQVSRPSTVLSNRRWRSEYVSD